MPDALSLPEPAGFRTRYRSEPGMIGHYPWTYADQSRRPHPLRQRPGTESEDLFTAADLHAFAAAARADERERCATVVEKFNRWLGTAREEIAAAIRARTEGATDGLQTLAPAQGSAPALGRRAG